MKKALHIPFFLAVAALCKVLRPSQRHLHVALCNVGQAQSVVQSAAPKAHATQWLGGLRNSATLLFFKITNVVYVYTYTYTYREIIGNAFEVGRGAPCEVVSLGARVVS